MPTIKFCNGDQDVFDIGAAIEAHAKATFLVQDGPHDGHTIAVRASKYNCGALDEVVSCSCGKWWQSEMDGCWQHSHQRQEAGDPDLQTLLTFSTDIVW